MSSAPQKHICPSNKGRTGSHATMSPWLWCGPADSTAT